MRKFSSLFFIFVAFLLLSGCSLSDPEEVTVQFIEALLAKSDDGEPSTEERIEVIKEVVSPNAKGGIDDYDGIVLFFKRFYEHGLVRPYFVAENPMKPQTDDYSSIFVRLPNSSFEISPGSGDEYFEIELRNEDGDWKITDFEAIGKSDISTENPPDWVEVDPLD